MSGHHYGIPSGYHDDASTGTYYDPPNLTPDPPRYVSPLARTPSASSAGVSSLTPTEINSGAAAYSGSLVSGPRQPRSDVGASQASRNPDNSQSARYYGSPSGPGRSRAPSNTLQPPAPPIHMSVMAPQAGASQSSFAPLTSRPTRESPTPSYYSRPSRPNSTQYLGAAGVAGASSFSSLDRSLPRASYYHGDGYDDFHPSQIADDGEDDQPIRPAGVAAAASGGAGVFKAFGAKAPSASYNPVGRGEEQKSEWLQQQTSNRKRMRLWSATGIILFVLLVIVGAVVGGVLGSQKSGSKANSSKSVGGVATSTGSKDGLWDANSAQIQAVMNNKNFHKVFPAMDYTPLNAQYPDCLSNPADQNNVTLDIALLSQLSPAVRLYGTDCDQTEMVLTAIDKLGLNDTMKVWLGVYLDGNSTTNTRQLSQMYNILDKYPTSHFVGVIVGNEVLYSQYMPATTLAQHLVDVKANLTAKGYSLPVSTADLGDSWQKNPSLATASDIVMGNIHPFFAGVTAEEGTSWSWTYWQSADVPLTSAKTGTIGTVTYPKQIISEIGWPSEGGHDCGGDSKTGYGCKTSTDGAFASVANMNTFMDGWVCAALKNGTNYFWFEAFDEPWKHSFDTPYDKWEPFWGLMDQDRNLKKGIVIPDCGGAQAKVFL